MGVQPVDLHLAQIGIFTDFDHNVSLSTPQDAADAGAI